MHHYSAAILEQSMGARNRVGIEWSFLGIDFGLHKSLKIPFLYSMCLILNLLVPPPLLHAYKPALLVFVPCLPPYALLCFITACHVYFRCTPCVSSLLTWSFCPLNAFLFTNKCCPLMCFGEFFFQLIFESWPLWRYYWYTQQINGGVTYLYILDIDIGLDIGIDIYSPIRWSANLFFFLRIFCPLQTTEYTFAKHETKEYTCLTYCSCRFYTVTNERYICVILYFWLAFWEGEIYLEKTVHRK